MDGVYTSCIHIQTSALPAPPASENVGKTHVEIFTA